MHFIIYMACNIAWAMMFMRFSRRQLNPPLMRCTTCGATLYSRPSTYRWGVIDYACWALVTWVVVWRHEQIPLGIKLLFMTVLLFVWALVVHRVVLAYFRWRHPLRCQGGGHRKPVPQPT